MSDANAEFIDALIRLLLEPVIFPFTDRVENVGVRVTALAPV